VILLFAFWLLIQNPEVQTFLTQKIAENLSRKYHTTISVKGVSIKFFNKVILEDVLIEDQKHDSLLFVHELVASIDSVNFKKIYVGIGQLKLNKTYLNISTDSLGIPNYQFLTEQFQSRDTLKTDSLKLDFRMKIFEFNDAKITYEYRDSCESHMITLDDISLGISDLEIHDEAFGLMITKFELNDQKEFRLEEFTAQLVSNVDSVKLLKLHARTLNSEITEANILIDKSKIGSVLDINKLKVNLELKNSQISLKDIGQLVPMLKGMDENIEVSGQISGTPVDLKGKNMEVSLGNNTRLAFDFYLNGLPDIANTYMQFDLKQSFADFNDLSRIKLPDHFPLEQVRVPANLLKAGIIEYKGNFTGFLSDFVAYGTFGSKWGVLNTDLSFKPMPGKKLEINGRLKTVNFQLTELAQTDILDRITFNGDIKGILNPNTHNFEAKVSGQIDSMIVNQYQYKNIHLNGDILNKRFDGNLVIDDPNLKSRFDGAFDLNVPVPVFNFKMLVENADLNALKLTNSFKESKISFDLNANFSGSNIDNLAGIIHFTEGTYLNENGVLSFNNIDLKTSNESEPIIQLRSDFLDADIRGKYELYNLAYSVKKIIANYLPSSGLKIPVQKASNNFDFRLELKDINRFTQVLMPALRMNPALITGSINTDKNTIILNANFPQIQYQNAVLKKFAININGDSKLNVRNKIEEIELGSQFKVYNLSLISEASGDVLDSKLAWNNFGAVSYSGSVNTSAKFTPQENSPHVEITVKPSRLYVADDAWQINSALITVDSTLIRINKLKLSNKLQSVTADGSIDENQDNKLNILFDQIDLSTLNTFIGDDINLKGYLNGSLTLFDIYKRVLFLSDLKIDGLSLLGQSIGNAGVQSRWDPVEEEIVAELTVESDKKTTLLAFGIYNPDRDSLSIDTKFNQFSLLILQPLIGSSFEKFHGDATGNVRIYGPLNHIKHDGALYANQAGLTISELQVNYNLNDSILFKGDKMIFPDIQIEDDYGNSGVFFGTLQHQSFSKWIYDLTIKSDRIMAFNTTTENNEQFYGKMFVSGLFRITGKGATILFDGVARTEKGTEMNISLEYEESVQEYDFLSFISHEYQPKVKEPEAYVAPGNLQMKFNVEVTPEAKAQLIYNSKIGDVIKAQGSGSMQLAIDNDYNVSLFGEFTFDQGDYLFTLQNVINKKFEIQQGGTIEWNGDPLDATINLNALYRLKTSLSEFFSTNVDPTKDFTQRIPVICKIALSKSLNNPDIKFDIELPTAEDRIKDEVKQFISSEEEMNKQILSLLVLGKFYTPEYLRGTGNYTGSNTSLAGSTASTASELASNQLSNWLSQISNNVNIGVNYRPGNQITPDEMELALSTLIFNDRVSINGNIGNNSSQKSNANNNEIVGEADVNVKLTDNGKLQLKAYNHSNNNLIYETSPYTQGVGIAYREDFNDLNELLQKVKSIFTRKPK
jgi:hypothetical protein